MWTVLLVAVLVGLGLEVHPGASLRGGVRGVCAGHVADALRARLGALLAVAGVLGVLAAAALALPSGVRDHRALRAGATLLAGVALLGAGWHRISTSSGLDLRRESLLGTEPETPPPGPWRAALAEIRRPGWHLFWWATAPGAVLVALAAGPAVLPLSWCAYAAVALVWCSWLGRRLRRGRERAIGTREFRILHSLAGLALVLAAGLLLLRAMDAADIDRIVTDGVLEPVLGRDAETGRRPSNLAVAPGRPLRWSAG